MPRILELVRVGALAGPGSGCLFRWQTDDLRRRMKKKTGTRSQDGRPKRRGELDRTKRRKTAKKKQTQRPTPLWIRVLSRVD
jgi:hypothetical protein